MQLNVQPRDIGMAMNCSITATNC